MTFDNIQDGGLAEVCTFCVLVSTLTQLLYRYSHATPAILAKISMKVILRLHCCGHGQREMIINEWCQRYADVTGNRPRHNRTLTCQLYAGQTQRDACAVATPFSVRVQRRPVSALSAGDEDEVDLGVTWDFEIQLTWNFFNSLSNLVGIYFFNSLQNFVTHFST